MQVTYHQFCKTIAEDLKVDFNHKYKTKLNQFPMKNGKRKIRSFHDAMIVDHDGKEYPYMINPHSRNEEKLVDFDYIYIIRPKGLKEIVEETGITLKSEKCRICEGGGWSSQGTRYYYKDIYCEV